MVRDLLLMLSTRQPPDPTKEVRFHADYCAATGSATAMATTRVLNGLTPGRSMVAFYGNAALRNRLLGFGIFDGYDRLGDGSSRGDSLLRESQLYKPGVHPPGLKGIIELRDVHVSAADDEIDSLCGAPTSGLQLTVDNLPLGPARLLVYFSRTSG
jgi:hypothetical protein